MIVNLSSEWPGLIVEPGAGRIEGRKLPEDLRIVGIGPIDRKARTVVPGGGRRVVEERKQAELGIELETTDLDLVEFLTGQKPIPEFRSQIMGEFPERKKWEAMAEIPTSEFGRVAFRITTRYGSDHELREVQKAAERLRAMIETRGGRLY